MNSYNNLTVADFHLPRHSSSKPDSVLDLREVGVKGSLLYFHQFGFVGGGGGFDFEDVDAGAAGGEVDAVGDKGKELALAEGVDGGDLSDGVRTQVDEDLVAGRIGIEQRLALAGAVCDAHGGDVGVYEVRIHVFCHEAARQAVVGNHDVAESATAT